MSETITFQFAIVTLYASLMTSYAIASIISFLEEHKQHGMCYAAMSIQHMVLSLLYFLKI